MKQWYPDITNEEYDRQVENVRKIQSNVSLKCRQRADWIARQQDRDNEWVGIGFIVGKKGLFIPNEDVMHDPDDEVFIDELATEVLGYAPDSRQDIEAQIKENDDELERLAREIAALKRRDSDWSSRRIKLMGKLAALDVEADKVVYGG